MKKKGFTLVELLAVIAILAILVLIVLPQVLTMFRKSQEDTFLIEARAIMNAAEKQLSQENFAGDVTDKIYCMSSGEIINKLDTNGREIFYLIYVKNSKIVMYAISDNSEHTVFNIDEENGLSANSITELYDNVIVIKDCDLDYIMATKGIDPESQYSWVTYGPNGELINVPYSGFTGYSCQSSNIETAAANLFEFNKNTKTITKFLGTGSSVVIPCKIAGVRVENIGNGAFQNKNIVDVYMPDTILTVGSNAFYGNKLESVYLGNNVKSIGCGAFANNKLTNVLLPRSLTTLGTTSCSSGYGVFQNNPNLDAVKFQSNALTTVGAYTFYNTKLSSIDLSSQNKLVSIGNYAFANNRNLGAIRFATSITSIGNYAFYGAGLKSIYLSSQKGVTIGQEAFADNSISKITMSGVKSLGQNAFRNNQMSSEQAYIMNVDSSGRETGVLNSYAGAARNDLSFPSKVTDISQVSFQNMQLTGTLNTGSSIKTIPSYAFQNNNLTKVIIGPSIKSIGQYAFNNSGVSTIEFAEGIETIGCAAFRGTRIANITFPNSLKTIESCGWGIFESNRTLKTVTFGKNLESIGSYSFSGNYLEKVDLSNTKVNTISSYAFQSNSIKELKLPDTLKTLGSYAFQSNNINEIKLPDALKSLGSYAFYNNKLTNISLKGNDVSIGSSAFSSNTITDVEIGGSNNTFDSNVFSSNKITKLKIDGTTIKIGSSVFSGNQIKEFSMKGVTSLGTNAFKNNKMPPETAFVMQPDSSGKPTKVLNSYGGELKSNIVIPDTVTQSGVTVNLEEIPSSAFSGLNLTGTITVGNNLKRINSSAFAGNSLSGALNLKNVTYVGEYAFASNQLTSATYPNVTSLGSNAFKSNKFPDSTAFVMDINSDKTEKSSLNSYAGATRANIVIPDKVKTINYSNFYGGSYGIYLTGTLNTGNGLKEIPYQTFYNNTGLTELTLGDNIETIGYQAFYNNSNLKKINWNNKIKTINWGAFAYSGLETLVLPDSLETIGGVNTNNYYYRYYKNGSTSYVPWSYSYTYYSPYYGAFAYNNKLTSVTFGSGIKTIEPLAFYSCSNLATINMSKFSKINSIPDFGFTYGKYSKITIPSCITSIGDYAFDKNTSLAEIYIEGKAQLEQFDYLGTGWNGSCKNIKFGVESCFEHNGGVLTKYNPTCSKKAVIPYTIDNVNITTIGTDVFKDLNLTSVFIPSTIGRIQENAFNNAKVDYIMVANKANENEFNSHPSNWNNGNHVIYEKDQNTCLKLDSNNVLTGYYYDASICNKNVTIPKTVTGTKANALQGMILSSIKVADGTRLTTNGMGDSWNGSVPYVQFEGDSYDYNCFTLNGSTITKYRDFCKQSVDLTTTNGRIQGVEITKIGANAFKETGLTSFKFTDAITEVGDNAFFGNYELSDVKFVNAVDNDSSRLYKIGKKAFYNCDLVSVNLPGSLKIIGDNAFDENIKLSKIIILNKESFDEFESLGTRWNGDCQLIAFQRNK